MVIRREETVCRSHERAVHHARGLSRAVMAAAAARASAYMRNTRPSRPWTAILAAHSWQTPLRTRQTGTSLHLAHVGRTDTLFSDDAVRVIHDRLRGTHQPALRQRAAHRQHREHDHRPTSRPPALPSPRKPPARQTERQTGTESAPVPPSTRRMGLFHPADGYRERRQIDILNVT
jgi:hypothetical protein